MKTKERLLKTKTDKKQFLKWIDALRSGKFSQTKNHLQDGDGYCCLGVACKIIIPKDKLETNTGYVRGDFPEAQSCSPIWLVKINEDFARRTKDGASLSVLNDSRNQTFKQIATALKRAYRRDLEAIK